jgi:hypothetical protein
MNTLASLEQDRKIRVFRTGAQVLSPYNEQQNERVFVTIGAGETMVTILNEDGQCEHCWTAVFGWSFLFDIPVEVNGVSTRIDDQEVAAIALGGQVRMFGRLVDTREYAKQAGQRIKDALDDILSQTVGSGARYSAIVFSAPEWMHRLLSNAIGIRPHIVKDISDT